MKLWKHIGETYGLNHKQTSTLLTSIANEVERRGTIDYDRDPGETSDWLRAEANEALKFQIAMTDNNHPITPPPEMVRQWFDGDEYDLAVKATRWGADQELEACCEWLRAKGWILPVFIPELRAIRRPKPSSLKEQALSALYAIDSGTDDTREFFRNIETVKKALESLTD